MALGNSLELAMRFQVSKEIAYILGSNTKKVLSSSPEKSEKLIENSKVVFEGIGRAPPFILEVIPVRPEALFLLLAAL